eukprot:Awhi_evm1s1278
MFVVTSRAYSGLQNIPRAKFILHKMVTEYHIRPSIHTFAAVCNLYAMQGNHEKVLDLYDSFRLSVRKGVNFSATRNARSSFKQFEMRYFETVESNIRQQPESQTRVDNHLGESDDTLSDTHVDSDSNVFQISDDDSFENCEFEGIDSEFIDSDHDESSANAGNEYPKDSHTDFLKKECNFSITEQTIPELFWKEEDYPVNPNLNYDISKFRYKREANASVNGSPKPYIPDYEAGLLQDVVVSAAYLKRWETISEIELLMRDEPGVTEMMRWYYKKAQNELKFNQKF